MSAPGAIRTRFAPSPTGDLHVGGAWTALASWIVARAAGGASLLRVEDLDPPRVVAGAEARILEDLAWLGLDWDETPVHQSLRGRAYEQAVAALARAGLVYPCDCSRSEIARVAHAPHPGEESRYPGTCRDKDTGRAMKRAPALRVRVPDETVSFVDGVVGPVGQNLDREVGDFVVQRGDGVFAYQLAVVVDDAASGVTDVVRGADLVASTARQIWLARALGARAPRFAHVPLVVTREGTRLEKRTAGTTIRGLREAGVKAEAIVGRLAQGLGLAPDASPVPARDLAAALRLRGGALGWRREPWTLPASW